MHKIFQTEEAAAFRFVPSRSGTPLLIVWTRESAVEQFSMVYKLDYGEFLKAASWKEVYECQDEDEEYRVHDTPKIYSTMPSAFSALLRSCLAGHYFRGLLWIFRRDIGIH